MPDVAGGHGGFATAMCRMAARLRRDRGDRNERSPWRVVLTGPAA
jgi:hypothetical protein